MAGAGYKLFNTGDVLTAAQVNTYLQEQAVMRFANATARTTALSGVLAEGMMSYLDDTNSVEVYNGTAWVSVGSTGDITGVTAGTGISGGGTSGDVTITNSMATAIDAKGDLIAGTGADAFSRLAVGANNTVLTADSSTATGLKWATPSASTPTFVGCSIQRTNTSTAITGNTEYIVLFPTEEYDTDAFHSTSTNTSRITIPTGKGGKYLVVATASNGLSTVGSYAELQIWKNGSKYLDSGIREGRVVRTASAIFSYAIIVNLAAGDYIEIGYQQQNTETVNMWFGAQVSLLGA